MRGTIQSLVHGGRLNFLTLFFLLEMPPKLALFQHSFTIRTNVDKLLDDNEKRGSPGVYRYRFVLEDLLSNSAD